MVHLQSITFACEEPAGLAAFWAAALEGERSELPGDATLVERPDEGPDLLFHDRPTNCDRGLPIHLDLAAEDREAEIERLEELGADVRETRSETADGVTHTWTVLEDPEGNGFCVAEH